ncbi:interferon-induced helicase C domain-containing protein 1-like [Saccoglossus kowalevskii]
MKFLCPENVGEARLEDVKTGLELFKLLIQKEHLSEDNTTILKDMLHETEQAVLWKRFQQEMGITTRTSPDVYQPQPKELDFTSATPIDNTDDETPAKCLVGDGDLDKASMVKSKQITMTGQSQQCGPSMTERIRDLTIDSPDTDDKIYNNKPSNYTAHSTHRQMGLQSSESNNLVNFDIETDSPDKEEEEKESACGPAFHSNNSTNKTDLLDESNTEFSPPLSSYTNMMEETPRRITAENVSKQLTFGKASCEEEDDELKLSRLDLSLPSEHADVKPKSGNRTCDDSTQKPAKTTKKIELYEYQKELVQPGLNGENYIICAPTGSGKTIAAAALCNELHKHAESDFKAVFIVPTRSLVQQQSDALKTFLPANSVAGINETDEVIEVFKNKDILVMTAQVLVNSLKRGEVNISGLTMIILDECHHTTLDHPYNEIMKRYLDIKFNDDKADLPQIVGLSASLGVGEDDDAFGHIKTLCAAMDAMKVAEVQKNIEELSKKVNKPIVNEDFIHRQVAIRATFSSQQ